MTVTLSRKAILVLAFIATAAIGVGIGVVVSGGSATATKTVVQTVSSGPTHKVSESTAEESQSEEPKSDAGSCDSKGINSKVRNEGTCTEEGITLVVVDKTHTLELPELDAKLLGIRQAKTLSDEGETKTASGIFVIFELEVTNKSHVPTYFDENQEQVALYLSTNTYTEDFEVENWVLPDSFVNQYKEIQPQETLTGTIAFDVPHSVLYDLTKTGNIDITNFSEGIEEAKEVGVIRTYE